MAKTIYRFMVLIYAVDVSVHKELGQPGPGPAWASQQRQAGFYSPSYSDCRADHRGI
jgi:hypothetical protein